MTTPPDAVVAHLVATDTPAARLDVLGALCACPDVAARQVLLQVGAGPTRAPAGVTPARVRVPFELGWLGARVLQRELDRRGLLRTGGPVILHAWSASALSWCAPLAAVDRPLLVDADLDVDIGRLARRSTAHPRPAALAFVCPSATAQRRLLSRGVPAGRCALVRPFVDFGALDQDRRAAVRTHLELPERAVVVTALPPAGRPTGTLIVAWAAMLLEKVQPAVRLIVPAGGREQQRVRRLVQACRHEWMARFAPPEVALPDLLVAADVVAWLPPTNAPTASLAWAMASGCPLVASAVPAVTELLRHGDSAWLCRPADVEDAARHLLQAFEHPAESRRQAERARAQALRLFSCQRMIDEYRQTYVNLVARRPVGAVGGDILSQVSA